MKKFLKFFAVPFIIVGLITVISLGMYFSKKSPEQSKPVKGNTDTDLTSNVFNYAGNLSEEKAAELDSYISQIEEETGIDIAVITLDESLEEYAKSYQSQLSYEVTPEKWVMVYADNFADEHKMGYDENYGSSLIFVDNIHREERTGKVYSWISTSGYAMDQITVGEAQEIMDSALAGLTDYSAQDDYYYAYRNVVELIPDAIGKDVSMNSNIISPYMVLIIAAVVAGLFILVNIKSKIGDRTTTASTYVIGGKPNMKNQSDVFLRKTVSKTKIETSSGSGGSGGHMSAGGHSHGGGGHSR